MLTDLPTSGQILSLMQESLRDAVTPGEFSGLLKDRFGFLPVRDRDAVTELYSQYLRLRKVWHGLNECRRDISQDVLLSPVAVAVGETSRFWL